ncbi:unnamed protein product [Brassicogethes aeneus]|uniref:Uncharacterized protein n=1 Tax=Brassicogethes aeneus TaxID=1431903 RepID=A0A9P0FGU9_BRAAE|nr:unnamed protein product [Brassicogethes aeneus]
MRFTSAVLVFLVFGASQASWMKDVVSPEGLKFGTGFVAKLQDNGNVNGSFLERVALKVDYGEIGVSVARNAEINDVEMSFYTNDVSEGGGNYEYQPSASQQYFAYNNHYAPSALAESQVQFQTVEAGQGNGTAAIGQETQVKRKDMIRKKQKITVAPTILTIRRYHLDK